MGVQVAVASGKGGTGKTSVATNLAAALADAGENIQLLDCDVEEPNDHLFLPLQVEQTRPVEIAVPEVDEDKCVRCGRCAQVCAYKAIAVLGDTVLVLEELCHGCGGCSLLCPHGAIVERPRRIGFVERGRARGVSLCRGVLDLGETLAPRVVASVRGLADPMINGIIDAAPGTACSMVAAVKGADYCLLVTEPTPLGLNDLTLALGVVRSLEVPAGVIINRWRGSTGSAVDLERFCAEEALPILMRIPFDRRLATCYAWGDLWLDCADEWRDRFCRLWDEVQCRLHETATRDQR